MGGEIFRQKIEQQVRTEKSNGQELLKELLDKVAELTRIERNLETSPSTNLLDKA
jgi:hypothetical protein